MRQNILLLVIFLIGNTVWGQIESSLWERAAHCADTNYTPSAEDRANHVLLGNLLQAIEHPHLLQSIKVRACPSLNNCITRRLNTESKIVLILYDTAFIENRKKSAALAADSGLSSKGETRDWVKIGIFAHELGHILARHVDDSIQTDPHQSELQADEWIGILLRKMGASLPQAQSCMTGSKKQDESSHPGREKRFQAIEKGYYGSDLEKAIRVFHAGDFSLAYLLLINNKLELSAEGFCCLAQIQEQGLGGVVRDTFEAVENYGKAIRADSSCCSAYEGLVRLTQEEAVLDLQLQAALKNCPKALLFMGYDFEKKGNPKAARKAYEKAALQNNPQAYHNLAFLYENGQGGQEDKAKALDCYRKAARLGYQRSIRYLNNKGIFEY